MEKIFPTIRTYSIGRWVLLGAFLAPLIGLSQTSSDETVSVSRVIRVIDGDTFVVDIDEFPDLIGKQIPIRVNRIDTPELRGECDKERELAIKAKERVEAILSNAQTIELQQLSRGSFFRIVADVVIDGVDLGGLILNEGLATPFRPGSASPWCTEN